MLYPNILRAAFRNFKLRKERERGSRDLFNVAPRENGSDGGLELFQIDVDPLFLKKNTKQSLFDDKKIGVRSLKVAAEFPDAFRGNLREIREDECLAFFQKLARPVQLFLFLVFDFIGI